MMLLMRWLYCSSMRNAADERYQCFLQQCHQCRQQLQQTELAFLSPPAQRSQCRYFNVEKLIDWAQKLLDSQLDTLVELLPTIEPSDLNQRLKDKLGWLIDYQQELGIWAQMVQMTRTLETQLKLCGLNQQSLNTFKQQQLRVRVNSRLERFQGQILDYLTTESSQIREGQTLLATSDVIESLFGKYKHFSSRCPFFPDGSDAPDHFSIYYEPDGFCGQTGVGDDSGSGS